MVASENALTFTSFFYDNFDSLRADNMGSPMARVILFFHAGTVLLSSTDTTHLFLFVLLMLKGQIYSSILIRSMQFLDVFSIIIIVLLTAVVNIVRFSTIIYNFIIYNISLFSLFDGVKITVFLFFFYQI